MPRAFAESAMERERERKKEAQNCREASEIRQIPLLTCTLKEETAAKVK